MKKILTIILILNVLIAQPLDVLAQSIIPNFNPNIIVPDAAFTDTKTFGGPEEIQKFLETKGSVLANTSPDFLAKLKEPDNPLLKIALDDPHPGLDRQRTAAELIWDASQSSGLNPQVILVTLNKEQGLITSPIGPDRIQRALNFAMGFDCPDASGCGNLFPGFYYQLFGNVDTSGNRYLGAVKSLMKSFTTPGGRGPSINGKVMKVGDSALIQNTLAGYDGVQAQQLVTFANVATTALYRYTPHVFNGNYNFWKYFTAWFKYSSGTLLKSGEDGTVYIIQNGARHLVPDFVVSARHLNLKDVVIASPTEMSSYPAGFTYGPPDNTVISANGTTYIFIDSIKHPVSQFVLAQRKIDPKKTLAIPSGDVNLFSDGVQLAPNDGTVLRGIKNTDVYLVRNGTLALFSPFTFKQRNVAKLVQSLPDDEMALYPKQGYVIPLNGTLVKSHLDSATYLVDKEQRRPLTPELFKNLGFNEKNIVTIKNTEEIASIPLGTPPTPREGTYFSIGDSNEFFLFKNGASHPIFPFVAKQLHIKPTYSFEASIVSGWSDGIAIPPANNTLVKSDASPTIYVVINGQLREVPPELFKDLGFKKKDVVSLPDSDVNAFAKGDFAPPRDGTYYKVAETGKLYLFKDGGTHEIVTMVAKQQKLKAGYIFTTNIIDGLPKGSALMPTNNTLVKISGSSKVYVALKGKFMELSTALMKNLGFKAKDVVTLPVKDASNFDFTNGFATPANNTYFKIAETGELYVFKDDAKHAIIPLVAQQRSLAPDYTFGADVTSGWFEGRAILPVNNTLVKGNASASVYIVSNKQLLSISQKTLKKKGYSSKKIKVITQKELNALLQENLTKK